MLAPRRIAAWTAALCAVVVSCDSCRDESSTDAETAGCTFASCDRECRAIGLCYGSCGGGSCHCSDYGCTGDVGGDDGVHPDANSQVDAEIPDQPAPEDGEAPDGGVPCDLIDGTGTRAGGSPGVRCCPVPKPSDRVFAPAAGQGDLVVFVAPESADSAEPDALRWHNWASGAFGVFDALSDFACDAYKYADYPSCDGPYLAYVAGCARDPGADTQRNELRLLDTVSGARHAVATNAGPATEPVSMSFVSLDDPWVVWRDVSEEFSYAWMAYALNVETLERRPLVDLSEAGVHTVGVLDGIALVDNGAITLTDLATGERTQVVGYSCLDDPPAARCDGRWSGVITPDWIAWLDSRHRPECGWFNPCSTKIYGWDRRTETEQPLVVSPGMHGPRLTGRGDWLVYEDQRDDPDPEHDTDGQQNIYGLHLPTMTEIRIEDWPGFQYEPAVYPGTDGWHVLFFEKGTGRAAALWDCTLPDP